jgi:hypothetical protein
MPAAASGARWYYDREADARHWEALDRLYGTHLYGAR